MSNDFHIPPRKITRLAAIDLDGTLCYSTWTPDQKRSVIGDVIPENVEKLLELIEHGYYCYIFTARHWSDKEMIEAWLVENNIPITEVICGKPLFDVFADDRNLNSRAPSWLPINLKGTEHDNN